MKAYKLYPIIIIYLIILSLCSSYVTAQEKNIKQISSRSIEEVFNICKQENFINNKKLLDDTINEAFKNRKTEVIKRAIFELGYSMNEFPDEDIAVPNLNYDVAKAVLRKFPDDSVVILLQTYKKSSNIKKANIIRVMGSMIDRRAVRNQLVKALDDKTTCEEEINNVIPLRICDIAYNEIVLNARVKKVLRTIANYHPIDVRDYHISILKNKI